MEEEKVIEEELEVQNTFNEDSIEELIDTENCVSNRIKFSV